MFKKCSENKTNTKFANKLSESFCSSDCLPKSGVIVRPEFNNLTQLNNLRYDCWEGLSDKAKTDYNRERRNKKIMQLPLMNLTFATLKKVYQSMQFTMVSERAEHRRDGYAYKASRAYYLQAKSTMRASYPEQAKDYLSQLSPRSDTEGSDED